MIIKLIPQVKNQDLEELIAWIKNRGFEVNLSQGTETTLLGVIGDTTTLDESELRRLEIVDKVYRIQEPYDKADRKSHPKDTVIELANGTKIGAGHFAMMAGPCSVESQDQVLTIARAVKEAGANILRGGAFKPRTSPYDFKGLGPVGIDYLVQAKKETGLAIVSEVMEEKELKHYDQVDILQVGARNMQNFGLLRTLGQMDKPILLKRGLAATYEEWLLAAEHIMAQGNDQVILCERGIRTFEKGVRNTFDVTAFPYLKLRTHLPVIGDPSHAAGSYEYVQPLALAATMAGADGLLIEVHNDPENALCDGPQSLTPARFEQTAAAVRRCRALYQELGRE